MTDAIAGVAEARRAHPRAWYIGLGIAFLWVNVLGLMVLYLFFTGIGVWNLNRPVCWAFDITNFVFWVGIGHAGTLISAILFLFRQKWRTSINRFAEAMTIFAVIVRRPVSGHPISDASGSLIGSRRYPNQMGIWPNFLSPTAVGRLCSEHLCHGVAAILVQWAWCPTWRRSAIGRPPSGAITSMAS